MQQSPTSFPTLLGVVLVRISISAGMSTTTTAASPKVHARPPAPADHYVRFHFIQLLKLYHNPQRDHQALFLCRQHIDLLLAMARAGVPHIRQRFHQLSVMEFFVKEVGADVWGACV